MSHSNMLKLKMVVAAVSWVLVFKMCPWHGSGHVRFGKNVLRLQ